MTEAEWLTCTDPKPMLEFLRDKASERKLRLFAVACCRRIWHLLVGEEYHRDWHRDELDYWRGCQDAVVLAERFADGEATERTLAAVTAYLRPAFERGCTVATFLPVNAAGVATEAVRFAAELPLNAAGVAMEAAVAAALEAGAHAVPSQRVLAAEKKSQCDLLRDVLGPLPFRPITLRPAWLAWHDGLLVSMAQRMYDSRDFSDMPVLADALEEAGCQDQDILGHCRSGGEHVRGCWVVDLLLGKE